MNREKPDKELDAWLDSAAAEYGRAELRPGFETRIIATLNGRLTKRIWFFRWIPAAAMVTFLLSASVYMLHHQFQDRGTKEIPSERHPASATIPTANADLSGKHGGRPGYGPSNVPILASSTKGTARHPVLLKTRNDKESRFLSSGLSDQERSLIAFARATSKEPSKDILEKTIFIPLQIQEAQISAFQIQDFEISAFEIEAVPITTP